MNYLCNQIATGSVRPKDEPIPFFAFLPDNYFLRAESLVPIYIVSSLDKERSSSTSKRRREGGGSGR